MILTILLSLSACDSVEDGLRQNLPEKSGITADENYTLMQHLKNSEQLDEEGVYIISQNFFLNRPRKGSRRVPKAVCTGF